MSNSWISTYSGVRFDLLEPKPDMFKIEDIAHALSRICRFGGHVKGKLAMSLAQHSIMVSDIAAALADAAGFDPDEAAFLGLMHDAGESYYGDVVRPLKDLLGPQFKAIAAGIDNALFKAFGIDKDSTLWIAVHQADQVSLATEARDLVNINYRHLYAPNVSARAKIIVPVDAETAESMFMDAFRTIANARQKQKAS